MTTETDFEPTTQPNLLRRFNLDFRTYEYVLTAGSVIMSERLANDPQYRDLHEKKIRKHMALGLARDVIDHYFDDLT